MTKNRNMRSYPEAGKTGPGTATARISQELLALAREAGKYGSADKFAETLGIPEKDIVWMKIFGSSVEGKPNPGDIDIFVAVTDGTMRFTKDNELYNPIVKETGMLHYFIMPESQAVELLDAMLYTGRKHPDMAHTGKTVTIESLWDLYIRVTVRGRRKNQLNGH
jgi:hypothetical protein